MFDYTNPDPMIRLEAKYKSKANLLEKLGKHYIPSNRHLTENSTTKALRDRVPKVTTDQAVAVAMHITARYEVAAATELIEMLDLREALS